MVVFPQKLWPQWQTAMVIERTYEILMTNERTNYAPYRAKIIGRETNPKKRKQIYRQKKNEREIQIEDKPNSNGITEKK